MTGFGCSGSWCPVLVVTALLVGWVGVADGAHDLNNAQLRLVADGLKLDECRRLVETLRSTDDYAPLDHTPDGHTEASSLSCYRLLELWNRQRPANSTFHQLLVRLQELGHRDLADDLSQIVYGDKVRAVKEDFLSDPFRKLSPRVDLRTRSELVKQSSSQEADSRRERRRPGVALELVTVVLALCLTAVIGAFICNRLTGRCAIKIPPRQQRGRRYGMNHEGLQESALQLLTETA